MESNSDASSVDYDKERFNEYNENVYVVDSVIDHDPKKVTYNDWKNKKKNKKVEWYMVTWKGLNPETGKEWEPSWEPAKTKETEIPLLINLYWENLKLKSTTPKKSTKQSLPNKT